MARRKEPRKLSPEERALWRKVAETAAPLRRDPPAPSEPEPGRAAPEPARDPRGTTAIPSFRMGERAIRDRPHHDLAPPISETLEAAPLTMDRRAYTRMKRGKLKPEARIDLHGMTLAQAHPALTGFILSAAADGKRLVLVITGKGRRGPDEGPIPARPGVLRHQVPHWLAAPPLAALVLQVAQAHTSHGGGGALYVYLRRPR
ncbi:DNA mismatch repair protein MutS [Maritimibacter sp. 55A14]|uniref:Smr/MutS family protein n=1 Tax=Maritimibacter sp. 55A14 TaxID=2174844 RepID=UPI000D61355B|nr:Smr/MutS family protein [Maritimibacter sp. 55A14]PWE33558.1 DNA mismatch repair protein MutS [Maritimibacter sp. 55A14]